MNWYIALKWAFAGLLLVGIVGEALSKKTTVPKRIFRIAQLGLVLAVIVGVL